MVHEIYHVNKILILYIETLRGVRPCAPFFSLTLKIATSLGWMIFVSDGDVGTIRALPPPLSFLTVTSERLEHNRSRNLTVQSAYWLARDVKIKTNHSE